MTEDNKSNVLNEEEESGLREAVPVEPPSEKPEEAPAEEAAEAAEQEKEKADALAREEKEKTDALVREEKEKAAALAREEKEKAAALKLEEKAKKEALALEKFAERRKLLIEKNLKKLDKYAEKKREELKNGEEKAKRKTDDETEKKEIEKLGREKRAELEDELKHKRRQIECSSGARLSYERKKRLYGYGFIGLWMVGVLYMFIFPLIQSINYSLNETAIVSSNDAERYGMDSAGIFLRWNDFGHYKYAFLTDSKYPVELFASLGNMVPRVLLILVFSLFIAILLNQKFKGRTVMRAIFFLPVLIATGPIISVINGDIMSQGASGGAAQFSTLFKTDLVDGFMRFLGLYNLSEGFTTFVSEATSDIFNLIWKSGIQILIFLAALQQIPVSAKEAASMEGASGWEFFWKISFPTISPMILANLIYTVIDTFSDSENAVMRIVVSQVRNLQYGYSAAIAWVYFAVIAAALAIIVAIASRFVFYQVD
ncbi:MAG: sugar ABC transporter permease [Oscillospiraceae bacterium]|jgi:ABC-type sugar transport system permease subunit|nr:sugar ABC transporter permease [Oscillospiraceae bacterium]